MIKKEIVKIEGVADIPGPLNHVVRAGHFLFLSSQLSADLKEHRIISGDIQQQTQKAMENIQFLLERAGSSIENIVKTVVYMKNVKKDFGKMNEIYQRFFKKGQEPARVTVQALSPLEGIDIEIEATAIISA
jgi:2-iminobutanoate/2-iminopropanoate deaminase